MDKVSKCHAVYFSNLLTSPLEKRDGKDCFAKGPQSDEMKVLNKKFGVLHGVSSLLNLGTFLATFAYGFTLGGRILSVADLA